MAEYDFLDMMPDVVTIEARTMATSAGYPNPQYATPKQYPCLLQAKPKMIRTVDGNEKVSSAQIIVPTDWLMVSGVPTQQTADTVGPGDRVTLPDQSQPAVLYVEQVHDDKGLHHSVIYT